MTENATTDWTDGHGCFSGWGGFFCCFCDKWGHNRAGPSENDTVDAGIGGGEGREIINFVGR